MLTEEVITAAAAAAKSLQSCPTVCDPRDGSPPGSPVPGILQARTLEWVAISFSNAWKWKWKWSRSVVSDSSRPHGLQPTRLLRPWDFQARVLEWGAIAFSKVITDYLLLREESKIKKKTWNSDNHHHQLRLYMCQIVIILKTKQ